MCICVLYFEYGKGGGNNNMYSYVVYRHEKYTGKMN